MSLSCWAAYQHLEYCIETFRARKFKRGRHEDIALLDVLCLVSQLHTQIKALSHQQSCCFTAMDKEVYHRHRCLRFDFSRDISR